MREMKDSGVEWIDSIPLDWSIVPLKSEVSFGKGLPITKENLIETGIPVVSYGQIHSKSNVGSHLDESLVRYVSADYLQSNPNCLAIKGDIFVADTSEDYEGIGNSVLIDWDTDVFAGYHTVIVRPIKRAYSKYLSYLFMTDAWRSQLRSRASGIKVYSVTQGLLKKSAIIMPSESDVQRMTDYLDSKCAKIDSIIEKQEEIIEKLKEYKLSVITEAVTKGLNSDVEMKDSGVEWIDEIPEHWIDIKLKFCTYIRARLGWKGLKAEEYVDEGYPLLSAFNIVNSKLDFVNNINYINQERYDESPEIMLSNGDILLVKDGAGIGKCGIVEELPIPSTTNGSLAVITTNNGLEPKFLYFYFLSKIFQKYIDRIKDGMGVPHLFQSDLREIQVVIPTVDEQKSIVSYLETTVSEIDRQIAIKEKVIEKLQEYKKSLIYEVVTGKKEV